PALSTVAAGSAKVFYNGTILTMAGGKFSEVEALAIADGRIVAVGSKEEATRCVEKADKINLKGRCVLPGFIDPHVHVLTTALVDHFFIKMAPSIVSTKDIALDLIKKAAIKVKKAGQGEWAVGYGYDPSRVEGHLELLKGDLDSVTGDQGIDVPAFIVNQSGHLAYLNSAALAMAEKSFDTATNDYYFKDEQSAELTGVIAETAVNDVVSLVQKPTAKGIVKYCEDTWKGWAEKGVTTVFDCGIGSTSPADPTILKALTEATTPQVRLRGALCHYTVDGISDLLASPPIQLGAFFVPSIKIWADGSTQGFTAAITEPYLDHGEESGTLNHSDVSLHKIMLTYLLKGFQLIVHSNGDRATTQVLDTYQCIFAEVPSRDLSIMHRIEHFTVTTPEQIIRAKHLGLGVSQTINHVRFWGRPFRDWVLGPERASRIDPLRDDMEAGLSFSLHSDSPITDVDPLLAVRTAVTRQMENGEVLGEEQCVDLEAALQGITCNAAKHAGLETEAGTLEIGKSADFVVLGKDPREVEAVEVNEIEVQETWLQGVRTHRKGLFGRAKL
ncbi:MAG: hypothetical protein Q9169_008055, partial [Polycauliona sp. 2 TL-2023]